MSREMINLENSYISSLKKKLDNEQFTMTASRKLQEQEFKDLLINALYFLEKDEKIADTSDFDHLLDSIVALKDNLRLLKLELV